MNNKVWALAVLLLAAGIQARPQDVGEVAVEEVEGTAENDIEDVQEDAAEMPVDDFAAVEEEEAPAEVETIKDENKSKCEKCLLPIFRSKHDNFCIKCVEEGIIDPSEQQQLATALKCKKCNTKPKFRARHEDFCDHHCMVAKPTTTTTEEPVSEYEYAYEEYDESNYEDDEEEEPEEEIVVKKKHKHQHKKHKDKKKHKPDMDDDEEEEPKEEIVVKKKHKHQHKKHKD